MATHSLYNTSNNKNSWGQVRLNSLFVKIQVMRLLYANYYYNILVLIPTFIKAFCFFFWARNWTFTWDKKYSLGLLWINRLNCVAKINLKLNFIQAWIINFTLKNKRCYSFVPTSEEKQDTVILAGTMRYWGRYP